MGLARRAPGSGVRQQAGLWAAAKTASVSYTPELDPNILANILATGELPSSYIAHVAYLLDEVPPIILIRAVDSTARLKKIPARRIWKNIARIAKDFSLLTQEAVA